MKTLKFKIEKTATVRTFGNPKTATNIVFALHGYGQLGEYFIRKFKVLSTDYFIVVPEGPHRFYLQGSSGRVGASWMTKENREEDIRDYILYLNQLWDNLNLKYTFKNKYLLGFSQGGATAARWHELGKFKANVFILWGAIFPPDLSQQWNENFNFSINYFVVGKNDPYITNEKIVTQTQYFTNNRINLINIEFEGKHEIDSKTLLKICP